MLIFEYGLILLIAVLLSNLINRFIPFVSVPIIQIILGILVALFPFGESSFSFELEPELFFTLFIALLVFNSSMTSDKKTFWKMRREIINMAIILVVITVITVGGFLHFLIPAIPFAAAFALIGALAPTDMVAVEAVAKRVGVPSKIMGILTGESIVNDASGIVCFQFALAAMMTGSFSVVKASLNFLLLGLGGILVGVLLTWGKYIFVRWIRSLGMENVTLHILIEILTPLLIYMLAEAIPVSGILAVFAAGMIHSFMRDKFNPETVNLNIASDSVWSVLSFTLDGLVFVILGTQLPNILKTASSVSFPISWIQIVVYVLLITMAILLLRFIWWMLTISKEVYFEPDKPINKIKSGIIFTLSGARGTVTLATAMSIPKRISEETAFPQLDLILLLCVGVIVTSLLITNFILPFFTEKTIATVTKEDEAVVYAEILQGVITQLNHLENVEESGATKAVIRSYYARSTDLLRKDKVTKQEKMYERKLRLEILQWEKDSINQMLLEGLIDTSTANQYRYMADARAKQLGSRSAKRFTRKIRWMLGFMVHRISQNNSSLADRANFAIMERSRQYIINKLYEVKKQDNNKIVSKLIAEFEMSMLLFRNIKNRDDEITLQKPDKDSIFEMVAKGYQIERDLIQKMFENGRISRETAKEMRGNIIVLESQLK